MDQPSSQSKHRQRASRKGAPRRFSCAYAGCDKRYTRAEHLARHQLNHSPKEIYYCDIEGCQQNFVRADLLARHKERHSTLSATQRGESADSDGFNLLQAEEAVGQEWMSAGPLQSDARTTDVTSQSPVAQRHNQVASRHESATSNFQATEQARQTSTQHYFPTEMHAARAVGISAQSTVPEEAESTSLLTPESAHAQAFGYNSVHYRQNDEPPWSMPSEHSLTNRLLYSSGQANAIANTPLAQSNGHGGAPVFYTGEETQQTRENFATWLFDSPGTTAELDMANLPFVDFGLESTFSNAFHHTSDTGSVHNRANSFDFRPFESVEALDVRISEYRRMELLQLIRAFLRRKRFPLSVRSDSILEELDNGDMPRLSTTLLQGCMTAFWNHVSYQMPILHRPTFSCDATRPLLLLVMVALGASTLVKLNPKSTMTDYADLGNLLASNLRWEIFTDDDAHPPMELWVAQALLLLELYEKMYSSRRLHERAHIHHASTLTLLRRGSPLIGQSENETPPTAGTMSNAEHEGSLVRSAEISSHAWWVQWARTEAMHRVVYAAFMMDILHAVMFGHAADMAPHEIRLPLPCDEALWTATSVDDVQRLEASLKMYGIRPVGFLDGLKRSLHGHEVKTHHFARVILMCGLLSVGWHMSHRETQLKWLETSPSAKEQERWRTILLGAFGAWNRSFDDALGNFRSLASGSSNKGAYNTLGDPAVLFHLAHISMHVDITDCQVFAGSKRLLSRRISSRDHANVVQRMKAWTHTSGARHAVLYAFKFLYEVLVRPFSPNQSPNHTSNWQQAPPASYSCRRDPLNYRPWVVYLAALTIWAYQHAINASSPLIQPSSVSGNVHSRAREYLSTFAALSNPDGLIILSTNEGCAAMLEVLQESFADAESEILLEAAKRLEACRELLGKR